MNFGVLNIAITHWNQHTFVKYLIANERQKTIEWKRIKPNAILIFYILPFQSSTYNKKFTKKIKFHCITSKILSRPLKKFTSHTKKPSNLQKISTLKSPNPLTPDLFYLSPSKKKNHQIFRLSNHKKPSLSKKLCH